MRIGVTDPMGSDDRFQSYARWLLRFAPGAEIVRLSYRAGDAAAAMTCDGIVLTGGGDVDPALYGGRADHPALTGVDAQRDRFEQAVVAGVLEWPRPFLGICRGLQFVNVFFGGTLLLDVEEAGFRSHRTLAGTGPLLHPVTAEGGGILARALGTGPVEVNTYHHQAVGTVAPALRVAARADDGLVEALEYPGASAYFLLVQWHPERMEDQASVCAGRIAELFLGELNRDT